MIVIRLIVIGAPFPDIAAHIIQAEVIRRETRHRSRGPEAIVTGVLNWERSLPDILQPLIVWISLISPRKKVSIIASSSRILPLRLGRQRLTGPFAVGLS